MYDICMMAWRIGDILDIHEQLQWIGEAGFDGVGFHASAGTPGKWQGVDPHLADEEARARLRNRVSEFSMCEIHAPFAIRLTADSLLRATDALIPVLDFAGDIRASIVTVHADPPVTGSDSNAPPWRCALERLNAVAENREVVVGLEVTEGFEWIAQLGLPNVGVTLDVGHMYLDGGKALRPYGTIGEVVCRLDRALVHLHIHDYDCVNDHIELGAGHVDLEDLLVALRDTGYEKGLCLELNPNRVSPDGIRKSRAWLRSRIRELGLE